MTKEITSHNQGSAENKSEPLATLVNDVLYHRLVKALTEIDINSAVDLVFKKLMKIRTWNINEYYTDEMPTWAYVGIDSLENPVLVVESDEKTIREKAIFLCEIQLKGLHPKGHIKTKLQNSIRAFLSSSKIKPIPDDRKLSVHKGETLVA